MGRYGPPDRMMVDLLDRFDGGLAGLGSLIGDLEALLPLLEGTTSEWRATFHSEWATLETVHAMALDRGVPRLSQEGRASVEEAIERMRRLLHRDGMDRSTALRGNL